MNPLDQIETPVVLIDEKVLDANIAGLAASSASRGISLRPHVKTHKVAQIAAKQLAAGASGITVATVGEAEVFADHGVADIFIAYPLWPDELLLRRIIALGERIQLRIGTDSVEAVSKLASFSAVGGRVSIELDSGHHRSGALTGEVLSIARAGRSAGVLIDGLFTFPGHSYAPGASVSAAAGESAALGQAAALLEADGFTVRHLSGGSTPTAQETTIAQEIRSGVYVFGDAQQWELGRAEPADISLTVLGTVVSRHDGDPALRRVVVNAGSKVLGSDRPNWASGFARLLDHPAARVSVLSEHHATVLFPPQTPLPALGERLRLVPNHVCLTMNLVDRVLVRKTDGTLTDWTVVARGRNS
ncbi:alanine racemase [Psychromicrobium lacuslunae]|uniref:Alanine racemase n=1 Tax=Psychromicrobium lacuslunae TaxID=1618207 RepID=A0A0D4BYR5_9MICC|nr:alanine racemase [Psychromicrobium lacuslunae]AJT41275.1 alanine racemase [Psychromicrobium lacuslunae]